MLIKGKYNSSPSAAPDPSDVQVQVDPYGNLKVAGVGSGITASASFTPAAAAYGALDILSVAQQFSFTFANGVAVPSGSLVRILTTDRPRRRPAMAEMSVRRKAVESP